MSDVAVRGADDCADLTDFEAVVEVVLLQEIRGITHKRMMLSLANAFNDDDLRDFDKKVRDVLKTDKVTYMCELKIDGLGMSLIYNGNLQCAVTRGDGSVGEDVTSNVITIKSIPSRINLDKEFEIRGEVYIVFIG